MIYCRYCYRMLEDGTEICTACGKSQIVKKKNPKKLFGLVPIYSEKDIRESKSLFHHAEAAYEIARESKSVLDFIVSWEMLEKDNAALRTYQDIVPPETFQKFSEILSKESEFQWRLRDAIEASKLSAISDIKGEYRNNAGNRVVSFCEDMDYVSTLASPETSHFALSAIHEVADLVGIPIDNSLYDAQNPPIQETNTYKNSLSDYQNKRLDEFAKYGGVDAELLTIDLMEGHDFEHWCANALRDMGYSNVEVTPASGDQGVDVLAEKDGLKYAIQCKRYSSDLGNSPIQEVHAGKYIYHCHVASVITNRYFTSGAKELAAATGVLLWDRNWITDYLNSKVSADGSLHIERSAHKNIHDNISVYVDGDELLPAAVDIILETGQASVSMLQRRLKLGYARAAQILDEMEEKGIVGPFHGSTPRAILVTKEQWQKLRTK